MNHEFPLESLLSARQLVEAKISGDKVYFISNMSGAYSLYEMEKQGSIPIPLLPEGTALQNPHLIAGASYLIYPKLGKIIISMDFNGDELYQPHEIPITGGIPKPVFGDKFKGMQVILADPDYSRNIFYLAVDDRKNPGYELIRVNLETMEEKSFGKTTYGKFLYGNSEDHSIIIEGEGYGPADNVLILNKNGTTNLLYGTPLDQRKEGEKVPRNGIGNVHFVENDNAVIFESILDSDLGAFNKLKIDTPQVTTQLKTTGLSLPNAELESFNHITGNHYYVKYNVDGCTHVYLLDYNPSDEVLHVTKHIVGNTDGPLNNGVALSITFDPINAKENGQTNEFIVSFTKATTPSQLYIIDLREDKPKYIKISNEKILGIPQEYLSEGEDSSYTSFDGLRISARLYRPSSKLGYDGPRPLIYYVHGGPQGQERPDFTWFSMPLIQYLTLNGFAVFVPNVRGSTGYGYDYMSKVESDWGGDDIKDHLEGLKHLEKDPLIDSTKRGVTGRSYGGYMTLSLVSRHPELWNAGIDLFGPYDLIKFFERLPPSWQTYFYMTLGHPDTHGDFLRERSPSTYMKDITAPLMVIQGAHDPRVVLAESQDIVNDLKAHGKTAELLVFEDEGHDVIKFKNKVKCYTEMTEFFKKYLMK